VLFSILGLENIIFATPESALHDPFLYTNMKVLVDKLYAFKRSQDEKSKSIANYRHRL